MPKDACVTCGHDVNGPPPKEIKREKECFPCSSGRLELENAKLRKALREMLAKYDGIDNGMCKVCRIGHRVFSSVGRAGKCEYHVCPSHKWRRALRGR